MQKGQSPPAATDGKGNGEPYVFEDLRGRLREIGATKFKAKRFWTGPLYCCTTRTKTLTPKSRISTCLWAKGLANSSGVGSSIKNNRFDRHAHTHIHTHTHTHSRTCTVLILCFVLYCCQQTHKRAHVHLFARQLNCARHTHTLAASLCGMWRDVRRGWVGIWGSAFFVLLLCVCVEFVSK